MIFPSVAGQDVEGRSAVAVVRADVSGRGARWQCSPAALAGLVERALYEAATGDVPFDPGDTTG